MGREAFEACECDTRVQSRVDGWDRNARLDATGRCLKRAGLSRSATVLWPTAFAVPQPSHMTCLFFSLFFSSFAIVSRARPFFVPLCFVLFTLYLQLSCGEFSRLDAQSAVGASSFLIIQQHDKPLVIQSYAASPQWLSDFMLGVRSLQEWVSLFGLKQYSGEQVHQVAATKPQHS
jgi:hypothetical protein